MTTEERDRSPVWSGGNWNTGTRGLLMAGGSMALASSLQNPWLIAVGLAALCQTLAMCGVFRRSLLEAIGALALRGAAMMIVFAIAYTFCALMVNAQTAILSTVGNMAMIGLLLTTVALIGVLSVPRLWRIVSRAPSSVLRVWAVIFAQAQWAGSLARLQLEEMHLLAGIEVLSPTPADQRKCQDLSTSSGFSSERAPSNV